MGARRVKGPKNRRSGFARQFTEQPFLYLHLELGCARGFLPIRKAGKLCVETDKVSFGNYSGRTQDMEMRLPAFAKGTKVLLADQWVETGGTMDGAIRLVERQGGTVVAMAAVAIEENAVTSGYRAKYRYVSGVQQGSHWQTECNAQKLASFSAYKPEMAFPAVG